MAQRLYNKSSNIDQHLCLQCYRPGLEFGPKNLWRRPTFAHFLFRQLLRFL